MNLWPGPITSLETLKRGRHDLFRLICLSKETFFKIVAEKQQKGKIGCAKLAPIKIESINCQENGAVSPDAKIGSTIFQLLVKTFPTMTHFITSVWITRDSASLYTKSLPLCSENVQQNEDLRARHLSSVNFTKKCSVKMANVFREVYNLQPRGSHHKPTFPPCL